MTILILCVTAFLIACVLDIASSISMTKYHIKEGNKLVRDSIGDFSLVRALFWVAAPLAVVLGMYYLGPVSEESTGYHRDYAPLVLIPGAFLHVWAWASNRRIINTKKANTIGGIV